MPDSKNLTDLQLAILRVLWLRSEATVTEVQSALMPERELALTTIATVLTRLEKESIVSHRTEGRTYIYQALLSEREARHGMVAEMVSKLFRGDTSALVAHLLNESEITPDEIAKVKAMIAAWEEESKNG
jgi:BlaI family penicillinase repressor